MCLVSVMGKKNWWWNGRVSDGILFAARAFAGARGWVRGIGGLRMFSAGVRRVLLASGIMVAAGLLLMHIAGCNTVKGVGRDIEAMGQGGQDVIDGKTR